MKGKGIILNEEGDLSVDPVRDEYGLIVSGVQIGNAAYQNQFVILSAYKGELKEYPVLGVGLRDIVNDNDIAGWTSEIRLQLQKDGFTVRSVGFDRNMNLEIEAEYEENSIG